MEAPLLENEKVTTCPFHVFDRSEIHIQSLYISLMEIYNLPILISTKIFKEYVLKTQKKPGERKRKTLYLGHTFFENVRIVRVPD